MNTLFLEMIGADAEQGAIIQKAEISKDFDILVYGPNERALNPDRDFKRCIPTRTNACICFLSYSGE